MIVLQLLLYCLLFTAMVKIAVIGGAVNGLYFYPKEVQDRAIELGLIDRNYLSGSYGLWKPVLTVGLGAVGGFLYYFVVKALNSRTAGTCNQPAFSCRPSGGYDLWQGADPRELQGDQRKGTDHSGYPSSVPEVPRGGQDPA